jgi:PKD repeat protein
LTYTLPTGHTTNDVLLAFYAGKPYGTIAGTPTDYTAQGSVTSGANTANTNGAGSTRVQAFSKIHDGSESNPTSAFTAQYSPSMVAMVAAYSSISGSGWTINNTTGQDSTVTGTGISVTGGSLTWNVGDVILFCSAGGDNLDTETSTSLSFSGGVTHSGLSELLSTNTTTTGNDGTMYVYTATINGAGTGAPTFAATGGASGASDRGVVFVQLREPAPPAPVASFTISDNAVWAGDAVNFTDTSTNTPTSWSWDFGSGASPATSTSQNPTGVTWSTTGTKTITMTATNAGGSDAADNGTVTVYATIDANFSASDTTTAPGTSITFTDSSTNTPTTWSWNFGSGATPATASTQGPHSVSYSTTGLKTVTLTAGNAGGTNLETKTNYIDVGNVPVASFTISDDTVWTGVGVNFTDTSTNSPTSWAWDFTAGTPTSSSSQNPTGVTWSAAESYLVTLTATNAYGDSTEVEDYVTVYNPVTANFSADDTTVGTGVTVTFTDASSAAATTWSWDFGSGASPATASTEGPHQVTYSTTGNKTVSLTAGNGGGTDVETKTDYIVVSSGTATYIQVSEVLARVPTAIKTLTRTFMGTWQNTFDGGTGDGNTITTGNTTSGNAWSAVVGAPVWSSTYPKGGTYGIKIVNANANQQTVAWSGSPFNTSQKTAFQFWWRHPGAPGAEYRLCAIKNTGGNNVGGLIMRTTSVMTIMQLTSAVVAYNSPALTAGNWYLVDVFIDGKYTGGVGATFQLRDEGGTLIHNVSSTFAGPSADTSVNEFLWGRPLTVAYGYDLYADGFKWWNNATGTISDQIAPLTSIPTLTATKTSAGFEIWNGTSWRNDFEIWNGTSWRTDVEIWNGTSWIPHV